MLAVKGTKVDSSLKVAIVHESRKPQPLLTMIILNTFVVTVVGLYYRIHVIIVNVARIILGSINRRL